jgi:GTP diphosphokinase / guanosine-3',5'-bis(diphosphate) 3'-diphosphatase
MRKQGLPVDKIARGDLLKQVADELKYADLDSMHVAVGEGRLSAQSVTTRVIRLFEPEVEESEAIEEVVQEVQPRRRRAGSQRGKGVIVEGFDDLLVRLARCCTPVPGDSIVGFLTRGRGVSVHRKDCPNAKALETDDENRMISVWWDDRGEGTFTASIQIEALDRTKLLRDVTTAISDVGVNILSSSTRSGRDGIATLTFTFELADPKHLEHVLNSVRHIDSVFDAYRVVPSSSRT